MDTVPVATLPTREEADEAAARLRASGIKCAVVEPPADAAPGVLGGGMAGWDSAYTAAFGVVVATEDEARARECLSDGD